MHCSAAKRVGARLGLFAAERAIRVGSF